MFEELNIIDTEINDTAVTVFYAFKCVLTWNRWKEKGPSQELGNEFAPDSVGEELEDISVDGWGGGL